ERDLARGSATYRAVRDLPGARVEDVAAGLPAGAVLVDFVAYVHVTPPPQGKAMFSEEVRFLAFVVKVGGTLACVQLGSAGPIEKAVTAWRDAVVAGQSPNVAGAELAKLVWQPLKKHLGDAQTVLIVPFGPLCGLPFGALPGSKPGSFLLQEVAIS